MRKVDPARHGERRGEIIEAAIRCFMRNGFHGSSIAALCAEAGMSPGHLYHYFDSKEAIIEAMVAANLEEASRLFEEAAEKGTGVVDVVISQLVDHVSDDPRRGSLLFDMLAEAARSPAVAALLHRHSRGMETLLIDLLRRGQESGEVDISLDPAAVAPMLISMSDGSMGMVLRNPELSPRRSRTMLKVLLERYLRPGM